MDYDTSSPRPTMSAADNLLQTFVRIRADRSTEALPVDASFWQRLESGQLGDFRGEYLVACHDMDADWQSWEMHPKGDELICLLSGAVRLLIETPTGVIEQSLTQSGSFLRVPTGCWHTAKITVPSRLLFITPGEGTAHRAVIETKP